MNEFNENLSDTAARTSSERHIEHVRQGGGVFVEAVRLTRMPMIVTDATLPGNPIIFANQAFVHLSGYTLDELLGQDPHFMNGEATDPEAVRHYQTAMEQGRGENLEILQYRKDGTPFRAMLFASPLDDGQGTVTNHFLSYLDVTRRYDAEEALRELTADLERRVAMRTTELEAANERLKCLIAERDLLMVEVNHRAKNSLAVAASLLSVQASRHSDPALRTLLREAQDHLGAMARVHDLLSRSETDQRVDLATYVNELCKPLDALAGKDNRIRLVAESEDGILIEADTAFPLGIVLTELVTNAIKYAYPPPRSGKILVKVQRGAAGRVKLVVQDQGVGMSGPRNNSLGYGLVQALVRQINGDLAVESRNGLTVRISFPS